MLRGTPEETRRDALALCAALDPREVLWVGAGEVPFQTSTVAGVRRLLGGAFDAVVLDVHAGLDADVLGQAQGFVRGGGALVLRWPDAPPLAGRERLAAYPFSPEDVGVRFFRRVERWLAPLSDAAPLKAADRADRGTDEQAAVVARLTASLSSRSPSVSVLLSDRGRGKSSALGLAIAALPADVRVVVSAAREEAVSELFRFATGRPGVTETARLRFMAPAALLDAEADVIVVDEAAQIPRWPRRRPPHRQNRNPS